MTKKNNPLINPTTTYHHSIPFENIQAGHFLPALKHRMKNATKVLKAICKKSGNASFHEIFYPLEKAFDEANQLGMILYNLNAANTSKELQDITAKAGPGITKFMSRFLLNRQLFKKVHKLYVNQETLDL